MKQLIITTLLLIITSVTSFSQPHGQIDRPRAFERIHAIKVAYITDKLHFTSEQSAKFWPIYDRYEQEVRQTRRAFIKKYKDSNPDNADQEQARQYVEDNLDYQQQVLDLKRKYNDDFLSVISPQQLADLYKAEREFKQLLIQQLRKRRNGDADWGAGRQQW